MIPDLKVAFKNTIAQVCPQFQVDEFNKELMNNIYRYAIQHPNASMNTEKGLFLYGEPGTGKSTILTILAEFTRKVNQQHAFKIIQTAYLAAKYAAEGIDALEESTWNRGINGNNPVPRGFDELGREPNPATHYGNSLNTMQYILELRYNTRAITHVTTNMSPEMIANAYGYHVADRAVEMFNFIEVKGPTRRK